MNFNNIKIARILLENLDYDVSRYIYETYFIKDKEQIISKKIINDQFNYFKNEYLNYYHIKEIYNYNNCLIKRRNNLKRLNFNLYLRFKRKHKYIKKKKRNKIIIKSYRRALQYKFDSDKLKKEIYNNEY